MNAVVVRQNRGGSDGGVVCVGEFVFADQTLRDVDLLQRFAAKTPLMELPGAAGDERDDHDDRDRGCCGASPSRRRDCNRFARHRPKLLVHFRSVAVAFIDVFGQRLLHHCIELWRHVGPEIVHRMRRLRKDRLDNLRRCRAFEWPSSRKHLVLNDAEREDIGSRTDVAADELLRRHVGDRSDGDTGIRLHHGRGIFAAKLAKLRQSEIEHFGVSVGRDDNVLRLNVAMDDSSLVGGTDRARDLRRDVDDFIDRHRTTRQARAQRLAFNELHRDEVQVVVNADLVNVGDIGMVQRRGCLRFLHEAAQAITASAAAVAQHFDGNLALEIVIEGEINLAHPARAEQRSHFVPPEAGAGCKMHRCVGILQSYFAIARTAAITARDRDVERKDRRDHHTVARNLAIGGDDVSIRSGSFFDCARESEPGVAALKDDGCVGSELREERAQARLVRSVERALMLSVEGHAIRTAMCGKDEELCAADVDREELVVGRDLIMDLDRIALLQLALQVALMGGVKRAAKPDAFARIDQHRALARRTHQHPRRQ